MSADRLLLHLDCRHFRGEKPCRFARLCAGCPHHAPMGRRILIVKLDAIGDVARTTPLLWALRRAPEPVHITWLVAAEAVDMLQGNPQIDVLLPYDAASLARLRVERFDCVLSLDKTPRAAAAAMLTAAGEKCGFGLSDHGTVYPLDAAADYAFLLGLSDDVKFRRNERTYQDILFEVCGLRFQGEDYCLAVADEVRAAAHDFWRCAGVGEEERLIGLNCGGGAAFAHKMWQAPPCLDFIRGAGQRFGLRIAVFGAARERELLRALREALPDDVIDTGADNSLPHFQALLGRCAVTVTGDSLGMHLALAEHRRTVILFGPTCAAEIELYGRGEKIVSPMSCAPCYRRACDRSPTCMEAIRPEVVLSAVERQLVLAHP